MIGLKHAQRPTFPTDHPAVNTFLKTHVKNGGSIPGGSQLQNIYMCELFDDKVAEVREILAGQPISVIFDEMPDANGRCVLNILVTPLIATDSEGKVKTYLLDSVFLDKCNNSTVAAAVVNSLQKFGVENGNVISFNTDNAALFPNSIHVTCMAHIMDLIGSAFRKPFKELNEFMMYMSQAFYMAGGRKRRYLQENNETPVVISNPCATQWNSWFYAVKYHQKYFFRYKNFFQMETEVCTSVPNSVEQLNIILGDDNHRDIIQAELNLVSDKCESIIFTLDLFQSQKSIAVKMYDYLEGLMIKFECNKQMSITDLSSADYFENLDDIPYAKKLEIVHTVEEAFSLSTEKLEKYMSHAQPAIQFLKQCRVFSPWSLAILSSDVSSYDAIPGFSEVSKEEFTLYFTKLGPDFVQTSVASDVTGPRLLFFWSSMAERLPKLQLLAKYYINLVINSADAERSNSLYNLILSSRRRSLSEKSITKLLFLYYNNNNSADERSSDEDVVLM